MKSIVLFEIKKITLHRSIFIILLLFTLLDGLKIYDVWRTQSTFADSIGWKAAYWELYPEYKGRITQEKQDKLSALYQPIAEKIKDWTFNRAINPNALTGINEFSDALMLNQYYVTPMKNFRDYSLLAAQICEKSKENIQLYHLLSNEFETKKNAQLYLLFEDRTVPSFAYTERDSRSATYIFSQYFVVLLCLFVLTLMVARENNSGMQTFSLTLLHGGRHAMIAKLFVVACVTAAISLWFSVADCLFFKLFFGAESSQFMPLYALQLFRVTPLKITIGGYTALCALLRVLGIWLLTAAYLALSARKCNLLLSFLGFFGIAYGLLWFAEHFQSAMYPWLKALNPCALLACYPLFETCEFLNIAGVPILSYQVTLAVLGLLCLLCVAFFLLFSPQNYLFTVSKKARRTPKKECFNENE